MRVLGRMEYRVREGVRRVRGEGDKQGENYGDD